MASNKFEDARSSMMASDSDAVDGSNDTALMNKPKIQKRPSRRGTVFFAWSFQVSFKADLSQGTFRKQKARLLSEHTGPRQIQCIECNLMHRD
jgi:hypothetical protein